MRWKGRSVWRRARLWQLPETESSSVRSREEFEGGGQGGSRGRSWLITQRGTRAAVAVLSLSASWALTGEQTKALVTQLTLFNQILVELRDDIRDQVGAGQQRGAGPGVGWQMLRADSSPPSCLPGEGDVPDPEHHHGVPGVR